MSARYNWQKNDSMTVHQAMEDYIKSGDFGKTPGGYDDQWVKLKLTKWLYIPIPNPESRRRAVRIHDYHHIATGYSTTVAGEAEILSFELGAGCGGYWFAWFINLAGLPLALFWPRRCWAAYQRGRQARSLYKNPELIEAHLHSPVADFRRALGIS